MGQQMTKHDRPKICQKKPQHEKETVGEEDEQKESNTSKQTEAEVSQCRETQEFLYVCYFQQVLSSKFPENLQSFILLKHTKKLKNNLFPLRFAKL